MRARQSPSTYLDHKESPKETHKFDVTILFTLTGARFTRKMRSGQMGPDIRLSDEQEAIIHTVASMFRRLSPVAEWSS